MDSVCPITLTPASELKWAVALQGNANQAYECEDLIKWIGLWRKDPLTNLPLTQTRLVTPLDICTDPAAATAFIEKRMGEIFGISVAGFTTKVAFYRAL